MIRRSTPGRGCRYVAVAVVGLMLGSSALSAADHGHDDPTPPAPKESIEQATQHLLRALELMLMAIPRYAPPEVLENGDIIIRRIPPDRDEAPPTAPKRDAPERTDI